MNKDGIRYGSLLLAWTSITLLMLLIAGVTNVEAYKIHETPQNLIVRLALKFPALVPHLPAAAAVAHAITASDAVGDLMTEHRCLAEVMYYEARGEGQTGQRAVADVVFNRLANGGHGNTLCGVVYEGANKAVCQFSFACDGSMNKPKETLAWRAAQILAARLMARELGPVPDIAGATNFHTAATHPSWASNFDEMAKIGNHIFYRAKLLRGIPGS